MVALPQDQNSADSGRYTPESIARQRKLVDAMMLGAARQRPIQHWMQGVAQLGESLVAGLRSRALDDAEKQNARESGAVIRDTYNSAMPGMAAKADPGAASPSMPSGRTSLVEAPQDGFQKIAALLSGGGQAAAPPMAASAGLPSDQASYAPQPAPVAPPPTFRPGITAPAAPAATLPRGLRNNNPLNIEAGDFTKGQPGFVGSDGRFARFETPEQGTAAASKLLDTYESKYGLNTPAGIIARWAPQGENNSAAYAATVAKKLGIGPNDPITPEMRPRLIAAMSEVENGRPAVAPQVAQAMAAPQMPAQPYQVAGPPTAAPMTSPQMPQTQPAAPGAEVAAALSRAPNAPAAPVGQLYTGSAQPGQPDISKLIAAVSNPYISESARSAAMTILNTQLAANKLQHLDLGNAIAIADQRGNIIRTIPKGEPNKGPEFGEVGTDPQTGEKLMGWRNPRDQSVTPYRPGSQRSASSTIPPVPEGVDPKVWREGQSKRATEEGMPASGDVTSKLRNEIQGLPSYKNLAQAAPVYRAMSEAASRDNRAADLNLIYGFGKIMDPGSVVRESEMTMAEKINTLPQYLRATAESQLSGSGRLSPEVRAQILEEAHTRVQSYKGLFDQDAGMYRGIAKRGRMNEEDVIPNFGEFTPWTPPKPSAPAPAAGPQKTKSGVTWSVE